MTAPLAYRIQMYYPASLKDAANAAAAILDPDTGGELTFQEVIEVNGAEYVTASIPIFPWAPDEYPELQAAGFHNHGDIIATRNPQLWLASLTALAAERGREMTLTTDDVAALCAGLLIDDEIQNATLPD